MSNLLLEVVSIENWALVGICFSIVLLIMAFFVLIMTLFGVIAKKGKKAEVKQEVSKPVVVADSKIDDATYAAIATALHLYFGGEHDNESNVLTIKNVNHEYSPWLNN